MTSCNHSRGLGDVRPSLLRKIQELNADGGTMIAPALEEGKRVLTEAKRDRVRRIVLASDGLDGTRLQSERFAREAFDDGITVSSLGIGLDFDEKYMGGVASSGHGNFAFVKDGPSLTSFLQQELVEASTTTISDATVTLRVPTGMRFIEATGADATAHGDEVTLKLGSLFAGDSRRVVCEFEARTNADEKYSLGADVDWTLVKGEQRVAAHDLKLDYVGTADVAAAQASQNGAVIASATSVFASKRELEAADAYSKGEQARAQALIDKNIVDLRAASINAPAAAAATIQRQMTSYAETKQQFGSAGPGAAAGKAAAKSAVAKDMTNMARSSF